MQPPVIVWFRQDLRLRDNSALAAAVRTGAPVIPLYIHAPQEEGEWPPGAASRWWLHHSLLALEGALREAGSRLILRVVAPHGPAEARSSLAVLRELIRQTGADTVLWNRRYEPAALMRDKEIKARLRDGLPGPAGESAGPPVHARSFCTALLYEPWDPRVRNKSGRPFRVFTPFWRHCLTLTPPEAPCEGPRPGDLPATAGNGWPASASLADLALLPHVDWARRFSRVWQPGEAGASAALQRFTESRLLSYTERRDFPGDAGTSRLSPHLHFGEISPRQVWHAVRVAAQERGIASESWTRWQFVTELGWREFSHHLLCHFPHTAVEPLVEDFRRFPWMPVPPGALPNVAADVSDPQSPAHLRECDRMAPAKSQAAAASPGDEARRRYLAWTRGRTGYPMVDAGMRELWATGWMHNRVRMITASFLVKHLLLPWQAGAQWFWDTLVDADLAQNTLGWQWSAGCGADAAPYFRIFNPITQGEKFDPGAAYIRRWVPELKALSDKHIHHPWDVAPDLLRHAGITLGTTYPHPIVDHAAARKAALDAFATLRGEREGGADAED